MTRMQYQLESDDDIGKFLFASCILIPRMPKMHAILFPGRIDVTKRPASEIIPEWIDSDNNLILGNNCRIPPTRIQPSRKLVFRLRSNGSSELIGITDYVDTFSQMADFSYDPPNPESHIHAQAVSHQGIPVMYNFEPNPSSVSGGSNSSIPPLACLRFSDPGTAPTEPANLAEQNDASEDEKTITAIQSLFASKPVWQRSALESELAKKISISSWRFAHVIRKCAYLFLDGPWRNAYVRFGYDPRVHAESRIWQMIDFRVPRVPRAAGGIQTIPSEEGGARSQLIQLSEVDDIVIRNILRKPPSCETADPQTGWLTADDIKTIRNQLKIIKAATSGFVRG